MMANEKEERGNKRVRIFWRIGTACIFDVRITDLDAARHRGASTAKVLEREERRKRKST